MESFIVKEAETELGELLYEKSDAKTKYDAPAEGKPGVKEIVTRVYMVVLMAGLLGWYIAGLVISSMELGFGKALVSGGILCPLVALIFLILAEMILCFTAFRLWGKFARWAYRRKLVRKRRYNREGHEARALERELAEADARKTRENALRIYPEYVVVINRGIKTVLKRALIEKVLCTQTGEIVTLTFQSYENETVRSVAELPAVDQPLIDECLPITETSVGVPKKKERAMPIIMGAVCLAVSGGVMAMHFTFAHELPLLFPILFAFFGLMMLCMAFNDIASVNHGVLPILGGVLFTGLPIGVLFTFAQFMEASAASLLLPFTLVHAVLSVFFGFGPMLLIGGIAGLITCIRHGRREK